AAFAMSFDTWSQAALFSVTAAHMADWTFSVALGLVFTLGMMVADGLNGLWVARLLRAADRRALIASRMMSLAVGLLSLALAALGLARYLRPELAAASEHAGILPGVVVIALLLASYAIALRLARQRELAK